MADDYPRDIDPATWTREGINRFVRVDGAAIFGMGRRRWCSSVLDSGHPIEVRNLHGAPKKFPTAGAAARFLALHHPVKGPSA